MLEKHKKRIRRHKRVRAKIYGTATRPRLCVFRSKKHIYAQLIDDEKGKTLAAASDLELKGKKKPSKVAKRGSSKKIEKTQEEREKIKRARIAIAYEVGRLIAKRALQKKIEKVVFDRGGYKYHGRVKVLSEGVREEGLKF